MRFATVLVTITNSRVVAMHHEKDPQKEIIAMEAAVWALWIFVFGVAYLLA